MIWIYCYLLNGIRINLDLDSSCWIQKMPNLTTLTFVYSHTNMVFHAPSIASPREIKLTKLDCINNCLTDN